MSLTSSLVIHCPNSIYNLNGQSHKLTRALFAMTHSVRHIRNKRSKGGQMSPLLFWLLLHSTSFTGGCHYLFWPSFFVLAVTIFAFNSNWMENQPKSIMTTFALPHISYLPYGARPSQGLGLVLNPDPRFLSNCQIFVDFSGEFPVLVGGLNSVIFPYLSECLP